MTKEKIYQIIFKSDTKEGKLFDVILLWCIFISVLIAVLDSLPNLSDQQRNFFHVLEWVFTILFSIEYLVRIYISERPSRYVFSFWGIIDLLAIIPTYLSLIFYGYQYLLIVRILRLLRVFRILRLIRFYTESMLLLRALKASYFKVSIFLSVVIIAAVLMGTVMYVVEHGQNGFTSIPQSIYWAIVTITTVGYGDVVPTTVIGKFISSVIMFLGYSIIAVPTGILTMEMTKTVATPVICPDCNEENKGTARYCNGCGLKLVDEEEEENKDMDASKV